MYMLTETTKSSCTILNIQENKNCVLGVKMQKA